MAITDYTSLSEAKIYSSIPVVDTSRDELITQIIPEVSRHIDTYCHRFFYPKTATTYIYDYQGESKLWLRDDLQTLTAVQNGDGTALDVSTLLLYPLNGPPYQWIEMNRSSGVTFRWTPTTNQRAITVTGTWGFLVNGATPPSITAACNAWISYLLKVGKLAGVKSTTIGDYTVSYSSVMDILRNGPPNAGSTS